MAEALSQSQIDELLKKMQSGEVTETKEEAPKLKQYDFTSPKKFTKDQLKALSTLYENFGRSLGIYLTGVLRSVCEVEISGVEEQRFYEFNNSLPDLTLVAMVSFEPEDNNYDGLTMLLEFPTTLGFLMVDRLMGGSGAVYSPERNYTEIEVSLLEHIFQAILNFLQESWNNNFKVELVLQNIETNGRMIQAYSQQDIVVISSLEVKEEFVSGLINVCMPAGNLEGILTNFNSKYSHSTKQLDPKREEIRKDTLMGYLKESNLTVEAILDVCYMNLNEIVSLQSGDIIALNKKIDADIDVNVQSVPWGRARIGEVDSSKAIKIVDVFERERGK